MQQAMDGEHEVEVRKRAVPEAVRANREARRLVDPISERIGCWQSESVRLCTALQRARQGGRHDPGLVEAARTLLDHVEQQGRQFDEAVAATDDWLATHSRIIDTRRSLQVIIDRVRSYLA